MGYLIATSLSVVVTAVVVTGLVSSLLLQSEQTTSIEKKSARGEKNESCQARIRAN